MILPVPIECRLFDQENIELMMASMKAMRREAKTERESSAAQYLGMPVLIDPSVPPGMVRMRFRNGEEQLFTIKM